MASSKGGVAKILSWIVCAAGVIMLVVGVTMYVVTSTSLKSEGITVAPIDEGTTNPSTGNGAGKPIAGPFTALDEIHAIGHHMNQASQMATGGTKDLATGVVTGGSMYFSVGHGVSGISLDTKGNCTKDGTLDIQKLDPKAQAGTMTCVQGQPATATGSLAIQGEGTGAKDKPVGTALTGLKSTFQTGSFLQGSLYVSVLAFGVSALIAGLGIVFIVVSFITILGGRKKETA